MATHIENLQALAGASVAAFRGEAMTFTFFARQRVPNMEWRAAVINKDGEATAVGFGRSPLAALYNLVQA